MAHWKGETATSFGLTIDTRYWTWRTESATGFSPGLHLGQVLWIAEWIAELMLAAWRQRLRIPDLASVVRGYSEAGRLRCLCVESNEDCLVALCGELSEDFGFLTRPFRYTGTQQRTASPPETEQLRREIAASDVVVTLIVRLRHSPRSSPG